MKVEANATEQAELTKAGDCGPGGCLFNVEHDPNELEERSKS